jgi:hypothetical protein
MQENNQNKNLVLLEDLGMILIPFISKLRYGKYLCHCGNEFVEVSKNVNNGQVKHCKLPIHYKNHKLGHHRIYRIWINIKQRCFNKNSQAYKNYGGRGITICDEWENDFLSFYNWALENGYEDNLTIDRKNNDGNYEPNNCRWVSKDIQSQNTRTLRSNNTSGYRGVDFRKSRNKYRALISVNYKHKHLGYLETAIEAAKAYDSYIVTNNLEHTRNFV